MASPRRRSAEQLRRLVDELAEVGLALGSQPWHDLAVAEIDYAVRPDVHERRVPSYGAIVQPAGDPAAWEAATTLSIDLRPLRTHSPAAMRRYADGIASWLIRRRDHGDDWAVFDRPAGSERDLVVLAASLDALIVQRHPSGVVRLVGSAGVFRFDGMAWRHEPPVSRWIDLVHTGSGPAERDVLEHLLEFAVHDLGAHGIGAILVYCPDELLEGSFEARLDPPPSLDIRRATDLAPLRHALGQIDGAALFEASGALTQIGVRLVPSATAEARVAGTQGTRHTSARRYSFDDPAATVIVVSEDGPVTVLRAGEILGTSAPSEDAD